MKYDVKFSINTNALVHNSSNFEEIVCFVLEAEKLNYDYIRLIDHVVGFVSEKHTEVATTPYTHNSKYHEVFTLMSYLSAVTEKIGFITGVLNLPQRQTALVAKQAAQVDLMSSGRLILGVGIGYNSVESQAMEAVFKERAPRVEEQIEVLRNGFSLLIISYNESFIKDVLTIERTAITMTLIESSKSKLVRIFKIFLPFSYFSE